MAAEPLSGEQAESLACAYLQEAGLVLVTRNYRCPRGELDLIMRQHDTLVFVEVRYRRSAAFGTPAETIDTRKRERLLAAARHYLLHRSPEQACRFDVIAISGRAPHNIEWIRNAIQAG